MFPQLKTWSVGVGYVGGGTQEELKVGRWFSDGHKAETGIHDRMYRRISNPIVRTSGKSSSIEDDLLVLIVLISLGQCFFPSSYKLGLEWLEFPCCIKGLVSAIDNMLILPKA